MANLSKPTVTRTSGVLTRPDRPSGPEEAVVPADGPVAILVAHGMGQSLHFDTLNDAVDGLENAPGRDWTAERAGTSVVRVGDQDLRRAELRVKRGGREREVHLYEAYWAPLTEGRVRIWDAVGFLFGGAFNGIKNSSRPFARWMFGGLEAFTPVAGSGSAFALGAATLASLVAMHFVAAAVLADKVELVSLPSEELTYGLLAFLSVVAVLGAWILLAMGERHRARRAEPETTDGRGETEDARRAARLRRTALTGGGMIAFGCALGAAVGFLVGGLVVAASVGAARLGAADALGLEGHLAGIVLRGALLGVLLVAAVALAVRPLLKALGGLVALAALLGALFLAGRSLQPDDRIAALYAVAAAAVLWTLRPGRDREPRKDPSPNRVGAAASAGGAPPSEWDRLQAEERARRAVEDDHYRPLRNAAVLGFAATAVGVALGAPAARLWLGDATPRLAALAVLALPLLVALVVPTFHALRKEGGSKGGPLLAVAAGLLVGSLLLAVVPGSATELPLWTVLVLWGLIMAISYFTQKFLVQFVGDVAAYVSPHKLDRFHDLRRDIKDAVKKVADAVYAMRSEDGKELAYSRVVVVGHSLGSVVAYDALNAVLLDDLHAHERQALPAKPRPSDYRRAVRERTRALVTFGSPLDRTGFAFSTQREAEGEATGHELSGRVRPLLADESCRAGLRWTNVYSRADIISSPLRFYDRPDASNASLVVNLEDPDASTPLLAHTEYWDNPEVWRRVVDGVMERP